jgi:thiamine biosynthesis lipoprotein
MLYDEFRAMNSDIVLAAYGSDLTAINHGFALSRHFINQSETRFTRFTDTSELAELNRSAGAWFQASDEMFDVLQLGYRLSVETSGLFNPAILPALKRAGYDRSMDEIRTLSPRMETSEEGEQQSASERDFRNIQLDMATKSILMPPGMQLDLGGIAKGWIAEKAARTLANVSSACAVSAGGDMFLINLPEGEPDWEVGLENPLVPEENMAVLHVLPGAVATSSITKRQWKHNGRSQHHLIDPRSGEPAQTEWLSTTVWAEQAAEAEVYAKVLLIAGPGNADALFKHQSTKAYLAVDKQGWVHGSKNYHEVFHV